ncbi:MAG: CobW family GTP-binding protein [Acetobacteraceae bacterium]
MSVTTPRAAVPVTVLTGFLGSGKTTLLKRLLHGRDLAGTAILINELGEVGIDHLLLERLDASTVLLASGCICCTMRSDLSAALRALYGKVERRAIAALDRVVIETTGLADPAPILHTVLRDPVVRYHYRLGNVVTTVDAVNGTRELAGNPESVKQAAVADRLILTKTDLVSEAMVEDLRRALAALNPTVPILDAQQDRIEPTLLFATGSFDPAAKTAEVRGWLTEEAHHHHDPSALGRHAAEITTFHVSLDGPADWSMFGIWLSMLLNRHGERILRVKGVLNVAGAPTPVCINGVQHIMHPPFHLERWPSSDRRSHLVFIVHGLDGAAIRRSLLAFTRLSSGDPAHPRQAEEVHM